MSPTDIDASLIQAYREIDYRVQDVRPFVLRVDQANPELAQAHRNHKVRCSTFITACNPLSQNLDVATNARLHDALRQQLVRRGLRYLESVGQHPSNAWPAEPSYLIFNLAPEAARSMGRELRQNAILWSGGDAVPRLVLLR